MKKLLVLLFLTLSISAKEITPNDVYSLGTLIQDHVHFLLKHYKINHDHKAVMQRNKILHTQFKPRNTWLKTYEILVKINLFRQDHGLLRIEPVGVAMGLDFNPDSVYEMNHRILTELIIIEKREGLIAPQFKRKTFQNKKPLDNYNLYVDISKAFDELNKRELTPDYVYAESMRIFDDITVLLHYLNIDDSTTPETILASATPKDAINVAFKLIRRIQSLQSDVRINTVDFSELNKKGPNPSDVFVATGIVIAELQTLKAYVGLKYSVTPPAHIYKNREPRHVEQLLRWNLKRINLIETLEKEAK